MRKYAEPHRKLILNRAPAGWGKSTLLSDWNASERLARSFAWLVLDRGDRLVYLLSAHLDYFPKHPS